VNFSKHFEYEIPQKWALHFSVMANRQTDGGEIRYDKANSGFLKLFCKGF
jgi:hypothetical protein